MVSFGVKSLRRGDFCPPTVKSDNVDIYICRSTVKNLKFKFMTLLDLYKLPDWNKRAVSFAVSVCTFLASVQRAT